MLHCLKDMYVERCIRIVAGVFIMVSVGLGHEKSPAFVSKWALILAAFVGINLLQFGFSDFCPMKNILIWVGVNPICEQCTLWKPELASQAEGESQSAICKVISKMDVARWIRVVAGTFVLVSAVLGVWVSDWILLFTFFVGANLFQFGFTQFCPVALVLRCLGVRDTDTTNTAPVIPAPVATTSPDVETGNGGAAGDDDARTPLDIELAEQA